MSLSSPRARNNVVSLVREKELKHSGGVINKRMCLSSASELTKGGDEAANEILDVIYLKTMKNGFGYKESKRNL